MKTATPKTTHTAMYANLRAQFQEARGAAFAPGDDVLEAIIQEIGVLATAQETDEAILEMMLATE